MHEAIIETEGLIRHYGDLAAVEDLSLRVERGQIFGFLGPNGAGKTTTIRMLLGLIRRDAGRIRIAGHDLASNRRAALARVGSIVETPALYLNLTGRQNLAVTCHTRGIGKTDIDRVLDIVDLAKDAGRKAGVFLGMRQRLGIARALLGEPELLVLDEPTNGLDPAGIREIRQLIADAPARFGTTILVSSHMLGEVEQMASHVGVMNQGRLLFQGTLPDLIRTAPHRLEIRLDNSARARTALADNWPDAEISGAGLVLPGVNEAEAAAINRQLVEAGFAVTGLAIRPPALEDIFLSLTGENA
ncbi:ABC transporter ATP-binding protein [Hyphobacterium sp. CCMP332]|uniref:ABC transporter ATP-binding protein n=1 Tax=Hyphobacterium sp. CCMP332 TaxID=2749086 RepID=UPI00165099E2|nr:ABC transporter ATP-binding protein [Hyphobacterium sp. CCMP332]QNL19006.1 ABC transporter ATP-binding protein [Hyphobacterium sp. CCMP332]